MQAQSQQRTKTIYGTGRWLLIASLLLLRMLVMSSYDRASDLEASTLADEAAILPEGASTDWWGDVQQQIGQTEYQVTWQEATSLSGLPAAYQAPNRANDLRTYFAPAGIRVIARSETTPAWEWNLALIGYGYAGNQQRPKAATIRVEGNRVEYQRGTLVEWYINDERGLEQGFTLMQPPSAGQSSLLQLDLAIGGNLTANLVEGGAAVELTTAGGVGVLRYADLYAYDANGHALPAQMSLLDGNIIRLSVDDSRASYPITIDPLASSPSWTAESNQADAEFGYLADTAGDVNGDGFSDVIVSARFYDNGENGEGAAFVYYGSATGLNSSANWQAEGNQVGAGFAGTVAFAGDVNGDGYGDVAIGAGSYDNGQTDEGRAYVYHGSATGLALTASWTAEIDQANANFGFVGAAGDVNGDGYSDLIVGTADYSNGQASEGAIFAYYGSATGLSLTANWMQEGNQANANLTRALSTAGDVNGDGYDDIVVTAHRYDNGQTDEGAAFAYYGSSTGLSATVNWSVESNQIGAALGEWISTAGDVNGDGYSDVIVGSANYNNGQSEEGRAFVYHGSASGLSTSANWTAESNQIAAHFAHRVGTAGDVNGDGFSDVIVGSYHYNNGETDEGRAFVYFGSATGLSSSSNWTAESNQTDAQFGISVGTAGDVNGDGYADVLVGARWYDNGQSNEGRAYIYYGSADGLDSIANWTAESNQTEARLGASGTAGDVNGDGYADLITGAANYDNGQTNEGGAFVYYGSANGLPANPNWTAESNQADSEYGILVSTAGDVNGDGYDDVIVGARSYDNGQSNEGAVFVYHGSATGLSNTANWTVESNQANANLYIVGTAGDVNGDGYSDVIVITELYDHQLTDEGLASVYFGSAAGLSLTPNWTFESDQAGALINQGTTVGDVNRDGFSDVMVASHRYDNSFTDAGKAYLFYGSAAGLSATPNWTAEGNQNTLEFGVIDPAGDINGDGYADIAIGLRYYDNQDTDEGAVYVYHGSSSGPNLTPNWTAEGNQSFSNFGGTVVATAGDVNGDGYGDLLVAAAWYDDAQTDSGRALLYLGSASGLGSNPSWTVSANQNTGIFGYYGGTAGDVNGDGYADIVLGSGLYDSGQTNEGKVFVYYGNGGTGVALRPQQVQADGLAPIASLGVSDSATAVQLRLTGRTPLGRDDVKMEWQVAPLGVPFTATGIISGVSPLWTDVLTTGVVLTQTVNGLSLDTAYHWRVRLIYDPGNRLGISSSRWIHIPWNGWSEVDFRIPEQDPTAVVLVNRVLTGDGLSIEDGLLTIIAVTIALLTLYLYLKQKTRVDWSRSR